VLLKDNGVVTGAGTVSAPVYSTTGDTNTGIFFPAADTVAISAGGTNKAQFGTGSATIDGLTVGRGAGAVSSNTAVGASALADNTTGTSNTANGQNALRLNTTGTSNTGIGRESLYSNTTGANNTAVGNNALFANTTGGANTALGNLALDTNTTGANNVAVGNEALAANTTASSNTAVGYQAGYTNTTGALNTFLGDQAGYSNTVNDRNCFVGHFSGYGTTGASNTFIGQSSGYLVTTGNKNTILGAFNGNQGGLDIRTSSNYIVLSDGDGNPRGWFRDDGLFFVPEAYGNTTANAANVHVGSTGSLSRSTSSIKYKRDVQDATHGLAEVLQLRPVTYKGKSEGDGETVFGGLIAEEVHDAGLTEFVQYAADGTPDALAYGNMVSLCVKAIQELSAQVTALQAEVNALKGQ
jgi:hypothetical protein